MAIVKPSRPYTEYNLFFQLEREYILQIELGFKPDYEPSEIFDPSDSSHYQGPPLPARYSGLVYLYDWHLPGKERRRKRRHRKTHGMIGFQELSLKIADAWKTVDAETRTFCAELCDMGMTIYKRAIREYKLANPKASKSKAAKNEAVKTVAESTEIPKVQCSSFIAAEGQDSNKPYPETASRELTFVPSFIHTDHCSMAEVDAAFTNDMALNLDLFDETVFDFNASNGTRMAESKHDSMVDLQDNEIIDMFMWKSKPATERPMTVAGQSFVMPPSNPVAGNPPLPQVMSDMILSVNRVSPLLLDQQSQDQNFFQADSVLPVYNMNNLGVALLDHQIKMQSNLIQAMSRAMSQQLDERCQTQV
jgi:hypothetical protein